MIANRRFTLPTHGVIELVLGMVTLFAPALFGFAVTAGIVAVVLGSLLIGMAVTISADYRPSLGFHHLFDLVFAISAAVATLYLAVIGEASAAAFFGALAVLHTGLHLSTHYVVAG